VERDAPDSLRFGVFLPPYHRTEQNPTLALHRDLELIERSDALGFDEVWVGEHHCGGVELIASPEQFLAAAACAPAASSSAPAWRRRPTTTRAWTACDACG
jgi:alkanesulfonate monooxygenase SsuD/methylene tetrahydromethanopterin reductase-like flavin-dependent oxidoreductase (luciferase family)